jgi:hypothetical protein
MDGEQPIAVLEQLLADKGEQLLRTAILLAGSRSPLQKALYEVAAKIPGVTVAGQYTDSLGRPGRPCTSACGRWSLILTPVRSWR